MRRRRRVKKKAVFLALIIVVLIVACLIFLFLPKEKDKEKSAVNDIIGTWTTDNVTVYEFDDNNKGKLIVPLGTYDFTYEIKDDKLFIDFVNEKSTDSKYSYHFKDGKLILEGSNGTFTFNKIRDKDVD